MKNKIALWIVVIAVLALPLAACSNFHFVIGTGNVISKAFDFKDFQNVEISNAMEYEIVQDPAYSVNVSAHENIVPYLDVYQDGSTLVVRMKPGSFTNTEAKAVIRLPELDRLNISGASKGSAKGIQTNANFTLVVSGASQLDLSAEVKGADVNISGASRVTGHLVGEDSRFNVSGASRCELDGSTGTTYVDTSGASRFNSSNLVLKNANVNISGASHGSINCTGTLNVQVTGASTLDYFGNPSLNQVTVNGASQLNKK